LFALLGRLINLVDDTSQNAKAIDVLDKDLKGKSFHPPKILWIPYLPAKGEIEDLIHFNLLRTYL
jgi:hypothetical protein